MKTYLYGKLTAEVEPYEDALIRGEGGAHIATVLSVYHFPGLPGADYEKTNDATGEYAKLFAAAPELLKACEAVAEKEGFCIFGCLELAEISDPREAYRLGSAHAFGQCAGLVREAIANTQEATP